MNTEKAPAKLEILAAAERIKPYIHRTPILTNISTDLLLGASLFFKCENLQKAGAFKSRGATNAVFSAVNEDVAKGVATHSSGNHAAALARAARLRGIPAHIVMPQNSSKVKIAAVESYGGIITFCKPTLEARESTLKEVIKQTGSFEIHPYDNYRIIAGQATAALELIEDTPKLDYIIAPVGGGGLLSGTALSTHYFSEGTQVIGAEPIGADDAFQSFTHKKFIPSINPQTIADGLRTSLGERTYPIIIQYVSDIITVSEKDIVDAMQWVWQRMKIIIEPSSAVALAVVLQNKARFEGKKVGIIFSGGNVDIMNLPW